MIDQLQLNIRERIAYSADNFIRHAGVDEVLLAFERSFLSQDFRILFVYGANRCGKTHCAITCSDLCIKAGLFPHLVDGAGFSGWLQKAEPDSKSVIIVDDAEQYFSRLSPGESGEFVRFIEKHRNLGSTVLFFSENRPESFSCDEHVLSRLLPGAGFELGPPPEDAVKKLLFTLARQRGMQLSEKKLSFVARRLPRDIKSLEDYLDRVYRLSRTLGKSAHLPLLADAL